MRTRSNAPPPKEYSTDQDYKCGRCVAMINKKRQCSRTTCITGPYCWQHTAKIEGVIVDKSRIPNAGNGLFALRNFAKGEFVSCYGGHEYKTKDELRAKYPGSRKSGYGRSFGKIYADARETNSGNARYINDRSGSGLPRNVTYVPDTHDPCKRVKTLRPIKAGEEFLASYGGRRL